MMKILRALRGEKFRPIKIEPYPNHIRAVFERSFSAELETRNPKLETCLPWRWPRGTWFQNRRIELRRGR
jgi:hypothetical protein